MMVSGLLDLSIPVLRRQPIEYGAKVVWPFTSSLCGFSTMLIPWVTSGMLIALSLMVVLFNWYVPFSNARHRNDIARPQNCSMLEFSVSEIDVVNGVRGGS